MLLVIDTNIIVNAIKGGTGSKSYQLMRDVFLGKHIMCVSDAILEEYDDVLHRKQLMLDKRLVDAFMSVVRLYSYRIEPLPTDQSHVEMKDEDDRMFFDVAKCLNVKLVTRNYKDYPVHELVTLIDELY
ncbi:MAG: putative toxin-antitoxin system toxin component, PIN family [Lachnospiraceae bacterium]